MDIYNSNGELILNVSVDDSSYRYRAIGGEHNLTLKYSLAEHVELAVGSYCMFQNERYTLERPESFKMRHSRNFEYTVTMEAYQAKAKMWKFRNPVDGRLKFSLTAKPHEHLQMFVDNMNRRDNGWSIGGCVEGAEVLINYDHAYCYDALAQMASELKTEFEFNGKAVSLGKVEYGKDNPLTLSYGRGNGFKPNVGRSNYGDKAPVEILFVQGGTDNIDRSKYGNSELHLPKGQAIKYDGLLFEDEVGFDPSAARSYVVDELGVSVRRSDKELSSMSEDSLDCSTIYPKRVGAVSGVVVVDADKNFYDIIDNTIPESLNYEDCVIGGETMSVIFQSGMLAGKEFDVKYHHTAKGGKAPRRFEIIPQEIDGQMMPSGAFVPVAGDSYAIFGCMLPGAYICDNATKGGAEWDMFRSAVRYMFDNEDIKYSFTGELDGIWAKRDWVNIGGKIKLGGFIKFFDDQFQKEGVLVRITGIKDYINNPHSPELTLSNSTVTPNFGTKLREIKSEEVLIDTYHRSAIQYTKRRFRDAKETMSMLEDAMLDDFTKSINPVAVQTMSMLVGDESLQFRFVSSMTTPVAVPDGIRYNSDTKTLTATAGIIQHFTIGISSVSSSHKASEYKFWSVSEYSSPYLDDASKKYYLYIKANRSTTAAEFTLSETAKKMESEENYYYFLVGILNSEYDGGRSFVSMYGFSEILPGRITTDRIVSGDGQSFFDLYNNSFKVGDNRSSLSWNHEGDGVLRVRGIIHQSTGGEEEVLSYDKGEWTFGMVVHKYDMVTYDGVKWVWNGDYGTASAPGSEPGWERRGSVAQSTYSVMLSSYGAVVKVNADGTFEGLRQVLNVVAGDDNVMAGGNQVTTSTFKLSTLVQVQRGTQQLLHGDGTQGTYAITLTCKGCTAETNAGNINITSITATDTAEVAIEVNCEGKATIHKLYTITLVKDGTVGKDGKYTETRYRYEDTKPLKPLSLRVPPGWSTSPARPEDALVVVGSSGLTVAEDAYTGSLTASSTSAQLTYRATADDQTLTVEVSGKTSTAQELRITWGYNLQQTDPALFAQIGYADTVGRNQTYTRRYTLQAPRKGVDYVLSIYNSNLGGGTSTVSVTRTTSNVCWSSTATIDPAKGQDTPTGVVEWSDPLLYKDFTEPTTLAPSVVQIHTSALGTVLPATYTVRNVTGSGREVATNLVIWAGRPTGAAVTWHKHQSAQGVKSVTVNAAQLKELGYRYIKVRSYPRLFDALMFADAYTDESDALVMSDGVDGTNGAGVSGVVNMYLASALSDGVTWDTPGWGTTVPQLTASLPYLWNYEITSFTDPSIPATRTQPAVIGSLGKDGRGIVSIEEWYKVTATTTEPTGFGTSGGWSRTPQLTTRELPYLWNYEVITYTSGDPHVTAKRIIGTHGADGQDGARGATPRYCGVWRSGVGYVWDNDFRDIVIHKSAGETEYRAYQVKSFGVPVTSQPPSADWEEASKFSFVAMDTALIDNAVLAGFSFKSQRLVSQSGMLDSVPRQLSTLSPAEYARWVPNLMLDGVSGEVLATGTLRTPFTSDAAQWHHGLHIDVSDTTIWNDIQKMILNFYGRHSGKRIVIMNNYQYSDWRGLRIGLRMMLPPDYSQTPTNPTESNPRTVEIDIPRGGVFTAIIAPVPEWVSGDRSINLIVPTCKLTRRSGAGVSMPVFSVDQAIGGFGDPPQYSVSGNWSNSQSEFGIITLK